MKIKRYGLTLVGLLGVLYVSIAYAGLWPGFPIVGSASYCSGSASTAIGSIIGSITGCPNTVPAGPTIVTGLETIPADTNAAGGANPQTVLLSLKSLNSLPIQVLPVTTAPAGISASNTSGGILFTSAAGVTSVNITLPSAPIDGQQYVVASNNVITTLNIQGSSASVTLGNNVSPGRLSVPNATGIPSGYTFMFNSASGAWWRLR